MKTDEQILEHLKNNKYTDNANCMILGFLEGNGIINDKIKYKILLNERHVGENCYKDFKCWFEKEEEQKDEYNNQEYNFERQKLFDYKSFTDAMFALLSGVHPKDIINKKDVLTNKRSPNYFDIIDERCKKAIDKANNSIIIKHFNACMLSSKWKDFYINTNYQTYETALANCPKGYRLPTKEDYEELIDNTECLHKNGIDTFTFKDGYQFNIIRNDILYNICQTNEILCNKNFQYRQIYIKE